MFGLPAMGIAFAGVIALVISTVKFEEQISLVTFYAMVIVWFLPVALIIAFSLGAFLYVHELDKRYNQLYDEYLAIKLSIDFNDLYDARQEDKKHKSDQENQPA